MPAVHDELRGNADCSWDTFDAAWYVDHNYRQMRDDDARILQQVRNYFAKAAAFTSMHGVDVGSGANLYPSLAMLPFCDEITLWEHSRSNVRWLRQELESYSSTWDSFWNLLCHREPYARLEEPREALHKRARVWQGDLFRLGRRQWDIGTMFFVAESITARRNEFREGVGRFIRALKPGAPFAAAFMKNSLGYTVGSHRFPAVAVTETDIQECLNDLGCQAEITLIPSISPLREGYDGMILALGWAGDVKR